LTNNKDETIYCYIVSSVSCWKTVFMIDTKNFDFIDNTKVTQTQ